MPAQNDGFIRELAWLRDFAPATRSSADAMPSLRCERLLVVCHLNLRMVPHFEALLSAGAEVHACATNPATTRNEVAKHLEESGVQVPARKDDPPDRHAAHLRDAVATGPPPCSPRWASTPRHQRTEGSKPFGIHPLPKRVQDRVALRHLEADA